jgi:nitrogen fixation NifU-like protein
MSLYNKKKSEEKKQYYYRPALNTERRKRIKDPDGYGKQTGQCGDTVEIFLMAGNDHINKIFFETNGCLNTLACANAIACLSEGKTITEAWDITPDHIVNYLETLPLEDIHCAELAAGTFYLALSNYKQNKRSPWKKIYQTSKT